MSKAKYDPNKTQKARQRAYRRLAELYPVEYEKLYNTERLILGMKPVDPVKSVYSRPKSPWTGGRNA